jgi:hypothetical protein
VTFDDVGKIALVWPGVEDGTVRKKLLSRIESSEGKIQSAK